MLLTPENICNRSYKRENVKKESDFTQIPSLRVCFYHEKAYFGSKILLEMAFFGSNWPFSVKINVKLTDSSVVVLIWGITRLISWFPILTDFIFSLFDKCLCFFVVFCVCVYACFLVWTLGIFHNISFLWCYSVIIFQVKITVVDTQDRKDLRFFFSSLQSSQNRKIHKKIFLLKLKTS